MGRQFLYRMQQSDVRNSQESFLLSATFTRSLVIKVKWIRYRYFLL